MSNSSGIFIYCVVFFTLKFFASTIKGSILRSGGVVFLKKSVLNDELLFSSGPGNFIKVWLFIWLYMLSHFRFMNSFFISSLLQLLFGNSPQWFFKWLWHLEGCWAAPEIYPLAIFLNTSRQLLLSNKLIFYLVNPV